MIILMMKEDSPPVDRHLTNTLEPMVKGPAMFSISWPWESIMLIVRGGAETEKGDLQRERDCVFIKGYFSMYIEKVDFLVFIGLSRRESES